jgi:hypothetical protein
MTVEFQMLGDDFRALAQQELARSGNYLPEFITIGGERARVIGQLMNEDGEFVDAVRIEAPERMAAWMREKRYI